MTPEQFGAQIQLLIEKQDLTQEQSYLLFRELMLDQQSPLQQGALLAALTAKGETVDEIAGAWQAIDEFDTVHPEGLPDGLFENSGTGMDGFKTFNVSSAAAIVGAANGVNMARHGARAITSRCGTVDIMEAMGIDVDCPVTRVADSIRQAGIGLFNGMSPAVHPGGLGRILSQIRFGSTLNIAASLANPARPRQALRGVYSRRMVPATAAVMAKIGYQHGMVVYGSDAASGLGMDELSICGPSTICRFDGEQREEYDIVPEELGLACRRGSEIAACNLREDEIRRFMQVIAGTGRFKACEDFVSLNAGALLWTAGKASDLKQGITMARETLASGAALSKLQQWVTCQNRNAETGLERFEQVKKVACNA
ncbi:anthranilate phosphoribosyltransferase [Trichlorobacter lovleyi]|uniref:anthranilate phosphoribosyltransferase n=1 Tax=Trichlorobacter lovleyi TaxID=313985 RepID=UPI00223F0759|nr:anthranilate phosphoribosyltransferase [Trichlorobacter lovleyi]QOX80509.1 anthranilate phosphoribosyltransferase [Trichlorobacter lovleyi]